MVKLTRAEWQLMNALWKQHPANARDIAARLPAGRGWAYSTIKTMLARLVLKGALSESKKGNVSYFQPLVTQRKAQLTALRSLVGDAFEGAFGSFMNFLVKEKNLSAEERRKIFEMLKDKLEGEDDK